MLVRIGLSVLMFSVLAGMVYRLDDFTRWFIAFWVAGMMAKSYYEGKTDGRKEASK